MHTRPKLTTSSSYKEICQRLANLTTPSICDAAPNVRLMDPNIKSIDDMQRNPQCIGRAYTINSAQDSLSTMQALDDLQAFLAFLDPTGTDLAPIIMVIAAYDALYALAGGMCANVAQIKGFAGLVTDGMCRDLEEVQNTRLPFFANGNCAKSGAKDKVGSIREAVQCGGVTVNPGDIIFGDRDGVVAMNKEEAINAITKAEEIQAKEAIALQRIKNGARFDEICNLNEHIENLKNGVPSKLRLTV